MGTSPIEPQIRGKSASTQADLLVRNGTMVAVNRHNPNDAGHEPSIDI
jgi:hypothetical protein